MNRKGFFFAVIVALFGAFLAGCGGGGGAITPLTGRATFNIIWPESGSRAVSKLIPLAANSIKIEITDGNGNSLGSQVMTRSDSSYTFNDLPVGNITAKASTFASTNGTGVALSTDSNTVAIAAGQTATLTLNMATTITALTSNYTMSTLVSGDTVPVSVSGRNANGDTVPVTASALSWSSSNTGVATVSSSGSISFAAAGTATITVTDTESGVSLNIPVVSMAFTVTGGQTQTINVRSNPTFVAVIAGPTDTGVTWSKVSGNGTVTGGGVFTAPTTPGTTVLRVTSNYDPTRYKDVTVTVQAGNATINVQ